MMLVGAQRGSRSYDLSFDTPLAGPGSGLGSRNMYDAGAPELAMQKVCEAFELPFGIFWRNVGGTCVWSTAYIRENVREALQAACIPPFSTTSREFKFTAGCGGPGRVLALGGHEWCRNVQQLPRSEFPRLDNAKRSFVRTLFCVSVPGGVVEFGSSREMPEDTDIVQFVKGVFGG